MPVWVFKPDPELLVVVAQVREATAPLRTARSLRIVEDLTLGDFRGVRRQAP